MVTKYPILDPDFSMKMLGSCKDDYERGLIGILDISGMHVSSLKNCKVLSRGNRHFLTWTRPKTNKTLEVLIPPDKLVDIQGYLAHKPHSRQHFCRIVHEIGLRAGFEGVSPMTFRHNRCIRSIEQHDRNPFIVAQDMGCSIDVVFRNYSKLKEI
jgi:hypothetical protein